MAFKFLSIGKANAEITKLEQQLAAVTKELTETKAALESNAGEVSAEVQKQIDEASAKVTELTGQITAKDGEISKLKADLESAQKATEEQSKKLAEAASHKAAEITAAQGQPPVKAAPPQSPAQSEKPFAHLKGLAKVIAIERSESAAKAAK